VKRPALTRTQLLLSRSCWRPDWYWWRVAMRHGETVDRGGPQR